MKESKTISYDGSEPLPRILPISGLPISLIKEELKRYYEKKNKKNQETK